MDFLTRLISSETALRRWTWASLVANIGIIVSGAIVRLTDSGLGCDTWPRCSDSSYVPHGADTHHALIEFGNRLITFVLILIALGAWLTARRVLDRHQRQGRLVRTLALIVLIGIPFQGVIGGITVLTHLNPFMVALHLLLSLALVVLVVRMLVAVYGVQPEPVAPGVRALTIAVFCLMSLACWLGTIVTGSGPHAGDGGAVRTGFDIETVARIHSGSVWLTGITSVLLLIVATRRHHRRLLHWAQVLVAVEVVQGVIGYTQYFLGLPPAIVVLHLLGAGLAVAAAAVVLFSSTRVSA